MIMIIIYYIFVDNLTKTIIGSHEEAAKKWLSVKGMVAFKA